MQCRVMALGHGVSDWGKPPGKSARLCDKTS